MASGLWKLGTLLLMVVTTGIDNAIHTRGLVETFDSDPSVANQMTILGSRRTS